MTFCSSERGTSLAGTPRVVSSTCEDKVVGFAEPATGDATSDMGEIKTLRGEWRQRRAELAEASAKDK